MKTKEVMLSATIAGGDDGLAHEANMLIHAGPALTRRIFDLKMDEFVRVIRNHLLESGLLDNPRERFTE